MDYLKLLQHGYDMVKEHQEDPELSRLEYLADYIFEFITYENEISSIMAAKCLEVCKTISDRTTFEYIKNEGNNLWYLIMVNMPFISNKITWGTSIRGAFWENEITIDSCGLFSDYNQLTKIKLTKMQWERFIDSMIEFSNL